MAAKFAANRVHLGLAPPSHAILKICEVPFTCTEELQKGRS